MTNPLEMALTPEYQANPYPFIAQLRENMTAVPIEIKGKKSYIFTRYDDCQTILRPNGDFGRGVINYMTEDEIANLPEPDPKFAPVQNVQKHWALFKTGEDHRRVRSLVNKAFTPKMVQKLRERAEEIAETLLSEAKERGQIELMSDFALRLPVTIIADMLGVPSQDYVRFRDWSAHAFGLNDLLPPTEEQIINTIDVYQKFSDYFSALIEEKKKNPQEDLISNLLQTEVDSEKLTEEEIGGNAIGILIAGFETTTNLIGNGIRQLMLHRDQWDKLVENPDLAPSAVEECLRFDSPVTLTARYCYRDTELGGIEINRLEEVAVFLASANHDPRHFSNPEVFDITRDEGQAMSFGAGIHFCLGAPLARMEADVAFRALVKHMPDLQLATDEFKWRRGVVMRGLEALPMTF